MQKLEMLEELSAELNSELKHIFQAIKMAEERKDLQSVFYWYNEIIMSLKDKVEEFKKIINK